MAGYQDRMVLEWAEMDGALAGALQGSVQAPPRRSLERIGEYSSANHYSST